MRGFENASLAHRAKTAWLEAVKTIIERRCKVRVVRAGCLTDKMGLEIVLDNCGRQEARKAFEAAKQTTGTDVEVKIYMALNNGVAKLMHVGMGTVKVELKE